MSNESEDADKEATALRQLASRYADVDADLLGVAQKLADIERQGRRTASDAMMARMYIAAIAAMRAGIFWAKDQLRARASALDAESDQRI